MGSPQFIKEIMDSMGWADGSFIPIANDENQKLLENVNKLIKEKSERAKELLNTDIKVKKLLEHKKNAEYDIKQNMNLIHAHRTQYESETHMYLVAKREDSKLKDEIKEISKEYDERLQFEKKTEREIKNVTKNIEKLSNNINWTKTCLIEWKQAISKNDETKKLIEKYCKEDETKAITIENKRCLIQDSINKQKQLLIESCEEQKSLEQTLDRTAQLYRQAHFERQQLVNTWKDAVLQMNQREYDIINSEKNLDSSIKYTESKENELKEQKEFLNQQILNNKEVEIEINELNRDVSFQRQKLQELIDTVPLKESELDISRKNFQSLVQRLQQERQKNQQIVKEKLNKEQQLENLNLKYNDLKYRYEKFRVADLDAQERMRQLEDMIEVEEKIKQELAKDIVRLNSLHHRTQTQINSMKDVEKRLNMDSQTIEVEIQGIKTSIREMEKDLPKLVMSLYDLDLKIAQIKLRIDKMKGKSGKNDPENIEKQRQLEVLQKDYEIRVKDIHTLEGKITKNEEDIRIITICFNNDVNELEKMKSKIKEAELYCEGTEKYVKEVIAQNQEKIVEVSLLKMRLNEMEKQIEKHEDQIYTLEKHRLQLENAISKRLTDIQSQEQLLFLKKKHLMEEKSALKADIVERQMKIDALKTRYDLSIELLGKNEDGTVVTTTQLKIAVAQEKQLLLKEGNELNEKVLKAENDIKAMENTLALMNYSNDSYKKTFEKVDNETPELLELNELQENYTKNLLQLKNLKSCIAIKTQKLDEVLEKCNKLEKDLEEMFHLRMERSDSLGKIHKELLDQSVKIARAERELKMAQKAARQRCLDVDYFIIFNKELDIRELDERNTSALQLIADFIDVNTELASKITQKLFEKGLRVPQQSIRGTTSRLQPLSNRSDFTDISASDTSLRIFSVSSKVSSAASTTSSKTVKSGPSIVSIDFGGGDGKKQKGSILKKKSKK